MVFYHEFIYESQLQQQKMKKGFSFSWTNNNQNKFFTCKSSNSLENKISHDSWHFMDDRGMKILYLEITYNQTVLYSILAENESIKVVGSIFKWFWVFR